MCALVTGVQTCALPISAPLLIDEADPELSPLLDAQPANINAPASPSATKRGPNLIFVVYIRSQSPSACQILTTFDVGIGCESALIQRSAHVPDRQSVV